MMTGPRPNARRHIWWWIVMGVARIALYGSRQLLPIPIGFSSPHGMNGTRGPRSSLQKNLVILLCSPRKSMHTSFWGSVSRGHRRTGRRRRGGIDVSVGKFCPDIMHRHAPLNEQREKEGAQDERAGPALAAASWYR